MAFIGKLHIQGVACYKRIDQGDRKRLMVLFPDGSKEAAICPHLCFLQFRASDVLVGNEEARADISGFVTLMVNYDDVWIEAGEANGIESIELEHVPPISVALPGERNVDHRQIRENLLKIGGFSYDESDLRGRLLVDSGKVSKNGLGKFSNRWKFEEKEEGTLWSSATTIEYSADEFIVNVGRLGEGSTEQIRLRPQADQKLHVWMRNACDGFHPEEEFGQNEHLESERGEVSDEDFVLNYKVSKTYNNWLFRRICGREFFLSG